MGAIGLPGDLSSSSRFVRAVFTKLNSVSEKTEQKSVAQFFHILDTVSQTNGCCELENGKFKDAGISKGLIITHINQTPVANVKEAVELMKNARRGFLVEGVYTNGKVYYYGVGV